LEYPDHAQLSLDHINEALELYFEEEGHDGAFKQKFMYRKAKALSMKPDQFDEALGCIIQIDNWQNEKSIKGLHSGIEAKQKQLKGEYNIFDLF